MESMSNLTKDTQGKIDQAVTELARLPQVECPLVHRFTPGLYSREIFMPAGSLIISKLHKTEHPYVISKGRVSVWTEESGVVQLQAPFCGITKPGTRRILFIHDDCVWTTFHPTKETDLEKIEGELIEPREPAREIDTRIIQQLQEAK